MPPKKFVGTIRRFAKPPTDVIYFNGWCYLVTHEISLACENEMFTRAWCTLVQQRVILSAVVRPSVCLSVRNGSGLW